MLVRVNPEVQKALDENRPVVALESTIISHGMPYPQNVETALAVEKIIREHGAVPATIGIIDGVGVVGMTPEEILEYVLADFEPKILEKVSTEYYCNCSKERVEKAIASVGKKDWGEALFALLESSRKPLDFGNKFLKPEEVLSFLGGAGNIDFLKIKRLLAKYGLEIKEKPECNVGKLQEIKVIRNRLAHGNLTFAKGMADKTINEIEAYMLATINTLEYLIQKVKEFYIVLNQDLETKICKRKE